MTVRGPRRGVAVASFLAGVLLTPVGVGVGLAHLAKSGMTLAGMLGVVALCLGVGLLVLGGVVLVRATPRWWRLVVVPALILTALLGTYVLAVPLRAALPPRADAPTAPPDGLSMSTVSVPTGDGEHLAAWYLPSRNGATVVLLPGSGSSRASLGRHIEALATAGFGVLAVDPRGQGASTGRGMDWGWYGEQDVTATVTYLTQREDVDPERIAVMGLSMGGEQAIGAAGVDPRIRAVVAEGVTGRRAGDLHWLSDVYGWRGALTESLDAVQTQVADLLSPTSPPPLLRDAAAAAGPRPLLLVVAGSRPDEQHAADDIHGFAPGNVQVWTVTDAGHTAALRTEPSGWNDHVLGFLREATQ